MGRKRREIKPGCRDWTTKIMDLPDESRALIEDVATRLRSDTGVLLCQWIMAGVAKEAKRLKIGVSRK